MVMRWTEVWVLGFSSSYRRHIKRREGAFIDRLLLGCFSNVFLMWPEAARCHREIISPLCFVSFLISGSQRDSPS